MINDLIDTLLKYGLDKSLIEKEDEIYLRNSLLGFLGETSYQEGHVLDLSLEELMEKFDDYAVEKGLINDTVTERDNFDTQVISIITPRPHEVIDKFYQLDAADPKQATEYFYRTSIDSNYIRKYRVDRDLKWKAATEYGELDITINLSKPEKDPRDIANARNMPKSNYPKCLLCKENEGYYGTLTHPARGNIRLIPMKLDGKDWFMQYSPYSYYNEHCIVLSGEHSPMVISPSTVRKLLEFLDVVPHYFIGSNADLPIVGGSILAHEHFQGGNYEFAMMKAPSIYNFEIEGFNGEASIVKWPLSVIKLVSDSKDDVVNAFTKIQNAWRDYSDEDANIIANTNGEPHNTITPISRKENGKYALYVVLRNNRTSEEYPLGIFHVHPEHHHLKKENIGLIEVMGLAVLPRRLKDEISLLKEYMLEGKDISSNEDIKKHAEWAEDIKSRYELNASNIDEIVETEIGVKFAKILENCGVFKQNDAGIAQFKKFIKSL